MLVCFFTHAQNNTKPNILVIFGDDIGWSNVSIYNMGMMGYKTPHRSHWKGRDDVYRLLCSAKLYCRRSAFITGQSPYRTGLLKVGLPGAKEGLQKEDPTIAELLKPMGYATGQFGKNHLVTGMNTCQQRMDLMNLRTLYHLKRF